MCQGPQRFHFLNLKSGTLQRWYIISRINLSFSELSTATFYQLNRFEGAFLCNLDINCEEPSLSILETICCNLDEDENSLFIRHGVSMLRYAQATGKFFGPVFQGGSIYRGHLDVTYVSGLL